MGTIALKKSTDTATADVATSGLAFGAPTIDLKRATAILARIADRKSTLPVLANACIRVDATRGVTLAATDLNISATIRLSPFGSMARSGGACVNAKSLADVVKKLPPGDVEIHRSGPIGLSVRSRAVNVALVGTTDRDFPKIPSDDDLAWHTADATALSDLISSVEHAVCKDETRFHLNGIKYECPDGENARTIATDGHRLAKCERKLAGVPTAGVIIPAKAAAEIRKLLAEGKNKGTCDLAIKGPILFVRYGAVTLAAKLIDAVFPPYEQVIPKVNDRLVTVERKAFAETLKRALVACSDTRGIKLSLASGTLTVTSDHPDFGSASERIAADGNFAELADFAIGFNPRYLLESLDEIDCKHVTIALASEGKEPELSPALIRSTEDAVSSPVMGASFLSVVMPMRI